MNTQDSLQRSPSGGPHRPSPKRRSPFLDKVRGVLRVERYAYTTEKTYLHWIVKFIHYHGKRHPAEMGEPEVRAFLTHLATEKNVSPATQNQALCALVFLYKHVLEQPLEDLGGYAWAKRQPRVPVVLSVDEVQRLLERMSGVTGLIAALMYGTGMRLQEAITLRVKDIDFYRRTLVIRDGKGAKDRGALLPESLIEPLKRHLLRVRDMHERDLREGHGAVSLPFALKEKYPNAATTWGWQFVFPSGNLSEDPREPGVIRRHHIYPNTVQRAVRRAAREAGILKHVKTHTLRHCFATHLLETGSDIRTIQELLGHSDVKTTEIYTHVLKRGPRGVTSPVDRIDLPAERVEAGRLPETADPYAASVAATVGRGPRPTSAATAPSRHATPCAAWAQPLWRWLRGIAAGVIVALTHGAAER